MVYQPGKYLFNVMWKRKGKCWPVRELTNWKGLGSRQPVRENKLLDVSSQGTSSGFSGKGLSSKSREVCSLLQAAETQDISSLLSYPRPTLNSMFEDFHT